MKLTPENKTIIDNKSLTDLIFGIRFYPSGNPWFQDETGDYWIKRYAELRDKDPDGHVAASKLIGWD
jgi:hypothetical protein